jgi:uroporphyrinogen-III synthase
MRVLITRPHDDASQTAQLLEARGYAVEVEPMLAVLPVVAPVLETDGIQAVLFTSANGARAMSSASKARETPVFTVGDASAAEARRLGYTQVHSAKGDVASLAALVAEVCDPAAGPLLHVAANVVAGDLQDLLEKHGFAVRKACLYESRTAVALSPELTEALKTGRIDAALFFSPRTAETFVTLAKNAGVDGDLGRISAYALSPAVADKLRTVSWRALRVADRPDQEALLAILDRDRPADDQRTEVAVPEAAKGGEMAMTPDKDAERDEAALAPTPAAAEADPHAEADDLAHEDAEEEDAHPSNAGRSATIAILLLVIVGLVGYASIPFWRDKVPDPYRSYLPDLPASETRTLIANLEQNIDANRTELARLRAEVKTLSSEVEDVTDAVSPVSGNATLEIGALKERLAAMDTRLRALSSGAAPGAAPGAAAPGATDDLQHRLDLVAGRVEQLAENAKTLSGKIDQKGLAQQDQVDEIAKRVDRVEATRAEAASVLRLSDRINAVEDMARAMVSRHDASLANLLAVVQLRAKAADGQPFDAELRTARALADDKTAFDAVAQGFANAAGQGVATPAALRQGFDQVAASAARAAAAPKGDSLLDKTIARVTGLVTVRRMDGNTDTQSVDSVLARTEAFLNAGDLASAVKEAKSIEDAAVAAALKPWIARAEARVALDAALSTMTADALARVAASAGAQQPPGGSAAQKTGG